jgi:hypothetical protein
MGEGVRHKELGVRNYGRGRENSLAGFFTSAKGWEDRVIDS